MESELIDRVQNSLRDLIYPDAIFKCELLCAEFPLEFFCYCSGDVRAVDGLCQCLLTPFLLNEDSVKDGDSQGWITDSSFEDGGSAEVLFARRSDAFQALKRYNNVQLDGRLMRIEIEGSKSKIPISARVNVVGGLNGQRTVVMRPSAETLFELICTWLHKGNYFESATKHDQPETEGPVGRLTKRNLQRLYGCQSNVVYGRSQLIDGLPPQVLRQILEILNFLATNHSWKEKVLEGEEIPQPDGLSIECIVHEALESPQYRSSGAGGRMHNYNRHANPLSVVHDEERMHDGLVVLPMPTAPTPPVLEVTVSRPVDPICRIASQPRAPEPPYAPPPPPPLPTLHGVVSLPPLQDVVPSLQPPPPPPMYEAPASSKISAPPMQVVPPPPARPPLAPPHPPSVFVEPTPPPPPHPFILVLIVFCRVNIFAGLLDKLLLERPSLVGYLRSITEMKATNIFENGKMLIDSMAASGSSNVVARRAIDEISKFSGETETPKYMKAFILQEISESRRLIRVLHDEVDAAKIALGQVNAMIAEMEAMNDPFEYADSLGCLRDSKRMMGWKIMGLNQRIGDTEGEIRTFEGYLDIMDAAMNSE
ncbi:E3 ubiquitin protein ligase UPL1-like protein [Tanacetum coccineum]